MSLIERVTDAVQYADLFLKNRENLVIVCHPDTRRELGREFAVLRGETIPFTEEAIQLEGCCGLPFFETHFVPPRNFIIVNQKLAELVGVSLSDEDLEAAACLITNRIYERSEYAGLDPLEIAALWSVQMQARIQERFRNLPPLDGKLIFDKAAPVDVERPNTVSQIKVIDQDIWKVEP